MRQGMRKTIPLAEAVALIPNGASLMIGGFMGGGSPLRLIDELVRQHKNALTILRIAENSGIQALAMHGRTRACAYTGDAEYDTIAAVKAVARIPIIANGDITTPEKAKFVLDYTGADAVMIGRAAQGRPWIFRV